MSRIARTGGIGMTTDRTRLVRTVAAFTMAGLTVTMAGIAYSAAISYQDKDGQSAQQSRDADDKPVRQFRRVQEKDAPDPVAMALKAAVQNGTMEERNARQIYSLLSKGVPGSGTREKAEAYLEEVAAKIDAAMTAGKLSAEDAEDKMIAIEKQMAAKVRAASVFEEELASRMHNDGMSKTEAYLDLAAEKLDEIVQTGELSAEDAQIRLIDIEKRVELGQALAAKMENEGTTKAEAYLELTAEKLDAMVRAGELSAEEAEDKLIALQQQIDAKRERASEKKRDRELNGDAYLEQVAAKLDEMVKAGKLSAEDAEAKLTAIEDSLAGKSKAGSLDARTVLRAAKRIDLDADQKDDLRDIEQETIGVYRKISRKDKDGHTELAEQVKAEITRLLDAEQKEQFEAALKRLDRGSQRAARKP